MYIYACLFVSMGGKLEIIYVRVSACMCVCVFARARVCVCMVVCGLCMQSMWRTMIVNNKNSSLVGYTIISIAEVGAQYVATPLRTTQFI